MPFWRTILARRRRTIPVNSPLQMIKSCLAPGLPAPQANALERGLAGVDVDLFWSEIWPRLIAPILDDQTYLLIDCNLTPADKTAIRVVAELYRRGCRDHWRWCQAAKKLYQSYSNAVIRRRLTNKAEFSRPIAALYRAWSAAEIGISLCRSTGDDRYISAGRRSADALFSAVWAAASLDLEWTAEDETAAREGKGPPKNTMIMLHHWSLFRQSRFLSYPLPAPHDWDDERAKAMYRRLSEKLIAEIAAATAPAR